MAKKMSARQRRSVLLMIRLRPDEARTIRAAAGLEPAATWVRMEALKAAKRQKRSEVSE